ncbi:MAG: hypothetical protein F8N38_05640, partial [Hungatella sp.]|nr:hypothetical protein [Hungatella sp.]
METDAPDYAPGSTVLIAGEYWTPGETVYLKVTHLSPLPVPDVTGVTPNPYEVWTVIADANGEVHTTWYVNDFEAGAQLQLEAYTDSGYDYRTFFTDKDNGKINHYPGAFTSFTGGKSYCQDASASSLNATWVNVDCLYDSNGNSDKYLPITITWYRNSTDSNSGGTVVQVEQTQGPKKVDANTLSSNYTPLINQVGTYYYYVTVSWADGNSGNGCLASGSITTSSTQAVTVHKSAAVTSVTGTSPLCIGSKA